MTKFSVRKRIKSFSYAFKGIAFVFRTQHNAWIHTGISIIVIVIGVLLGISLTEWMIISLAMGLVLSAEIINTAIEVYLDRFHPDYDPIVGRVKDIGAGAVLVSAIFAAIIGFIIFLPKLWALVF